MSRFLLFVAVGFLAQLIDGVLGMAYGVSATSFLLTFGVSPVVASASVHVAEVVTTGFSGLSHHLFGNVDRKLALRLVIPGVVGAVAGALLLVNIPAETIKPLIAAYLLVMGVVILMKARKKRAATNVTTHVVPLGLAGGFFDAAGGGGWGPIVTGTLLARGNPPRTTIGSVNVAEFFVALSASLTFVLTIGVSNWQVIAGLALGGAIAAPIAGWAVRFVSPRPLMIGVGCVVIILSIRTIFLAIG